MLANSAELHFKIYLVHKPCIVKL